MSRRAAANSVSESHIRHGPHRNLPAGRFAGGDETGSQPGPLHHSRHPRLRQLMSFMSSFVRCARYWRWQRCRRSAAGRPHPDGLLDCSFPPVTAFDVVNRDIGDDHVEALVLEGQRGHVGRVQLDAVSYSLGGGIA